MDMISLYNTKRKWGREWGRGEKRGIPWAGQLLSPQWGQGSRKWCLVPQMFAPSCWLRNLSWVFVRQAESKLSSKGHCFLRGREGRGGKKKSEIPMVSNVTLEKPHPIYSHFLPHGTSFTPHLRDSQVLRLNAKWRFLGNWDGIINSTKKLIP